MNYYLIDLENVRDRGLMGADLLEEDDTIVIFYSNAASTIHEVDRERIARGRAGVDIRSVQVHTKNALDFQLSLYVGILISTVLPESIFIISEDKGYKAVLDAGNREYGLHGRKDRPVFLCRTVLEAWYRKTGTVESSPTDKWVSVKELKRQAAVPAGMECIAHELSLDPKEFFGLVTSFGDDFHALYLGLLHTCGREKGRKAYQAVKEYKKVGKPL